MHENSSSVSQNDISVIISKKKILWNNKQIKNSIIKILHKEDNNKIINKNESYP